MADTNNSTSRNGLAGTLKLLAVIAVTAIGVLAALMVLDIIPREAFREAAVQGLSIIGIIAAVSGVISLIVRSK